MAFPGSIYAPPGPYTQTNSDNPVQGLAAAVRIPLLIGTGSEILTQTGLEVVRGSSASVDQRIVEEDETGRSVVSISNAGAITLGNADGSLNRVQVKNFPIVTGDGSGTTTTSTSSVSVTINDSPVVLLAISGSTGVLTLSTAPAATDEVRVTYFFNRTDTLTTDTVSDQVSPDSPIIYGEIGENFTVVEGTNDTLAFTVDSTDAVSVTISESPSGGWTAAQITAFINSAATGTTLVAGTATNNFGDTVITLASDRGVVVGDGTANTTLGLTEGDSTSRNKVFYTFQNPIVDGSNGGVTTTDTSAVVVLVDNVQTIPTAVDGATGAVTLSFAPEVGAVVTVRYYFNSWQNTFDYLQHRNVTAVTLAGLTPDRSDYTDGTDFILKDDRILWGSAFLIASGEHTTGATFFDDTQIGATLVDTRQYLASCDPVVDSSVSPPVENRLSFTLPLQPTTGNGRNTPLDADTFADVSNNRVDLPTNRPDLVFAYWGFSLSDAVGRGRVEVTRVESSTNQITLAEEVPVGATVYATFYYSTLQDEEYTLTVASAGSSGVGTYTVANEAGASLLTPLMTAKSAGLATITIVFPSGSESLPDIRLETPFSTTAFEAPVEEDVTVTFASQDATLGKYTVPGKGPYYVVAGASDHFDLEVDAAALTGGFVDLSDPMGTDCGFYPQITGDEVVYDADTNGATYDIDSTNNTIDLEIDGVLIQAVADASTTATLADYVGAVNRAAHGEFAAATGGSTTTVIMPATASDQDDFYVGYTIAVTAGLASGDIRTITGYVGSTLTATVATMSGAVANTDTYYVYDATTAPIMKTATRFLSSVIITAGEYDALVCNYTGSVTGSTAISLAAGNVIAPGTYTTAALLAAAVQTAMDAAITTAGIDAIVTVGSDSSGRLTFALIPDPTDLNGGFLEFVDGASTAVDFAVLAGLDTDAAAQGAQAKVVNGVIARRFTQGTAPLVHDRMIIRSRLIPGRAGSIDGQHDLDLTQLKILGGTGADQAGITAEEAALGGIRGTIMESTVFGDVGLSGGQVPTTTYGDARDGQPLVTFYAAGGTTAQNNVWKSTLEDVPVTVEFTDAAGAVIASGASADVPLGPIGSANTILAQIQAALTAAGSTATLTQEGAGIRIRGASSTSSASITIGTGSANSDLGFTDGDIFQRTDLEVETLVSALMAHANAGGSIATALLAGWAGGGATGYFAEEALAQTLRDDANAEYLYLQSQGTAGAGTTSSVAIAEAATDSVTRPGTGLGIIGGEGGTGEDAIDGFFVTSSDTVDGSGTANTSVLNSGTGQDGQVGQTYRDAVTGLTFSILERDGGASYPAGETLTFTVRTVATTDANLPINTVPGIELTVSNTLGITVDDTAIVETFDKGGAEPDVGDVYYVSYEYTKQDFDSQLFTKLQSIIAAFGAIGTENPVTMASYLAILNGAVLIAIKQVQKDTDDDNDGINDSASEAAFITAIGDVEGALPGGAAFPDYLVPLKGDSLTLFQYLAQHCDVQSSIRFRAERTGLVGLSAGTEPDAAGDTAQAIGRSRVRLAYPDILTVSLTDAEGNQTSNLVDGTYLAAAIAGNRSAPTIDVATPWTRALIVGFDEVARVLDAVEQNQVAVRGVTLVHQQGLSIRIRQGLTTDMTNILTKIPTVITIADEVQRQARTALDRFVGTKFLPGVTGQIETQMSNTLKQLQAAQIIAAFTGVSANVADDDPTVAEVEAFYQPIFPLLYIVATFNLRTSL